MAFETLSGGLELVIPTNGTTNWGTVVRNSTWLKINNHAHTGSGDGELLTGSSFVAGSITGTALAANLALTEASPVVVAATTGLVDFANGNKQTLDVSAATGAVTLTLSTPLAGASYRIKIIQGVTPRVITWPAAVLFPGGEEPSQYMEASTVAVVELDYDGTNYLAKWELDYV